MKSVLERDKKRRLLFKKFEIRRLVLKSLLVDKNLKNCEKNFVRYLLSKIPKDSSIVRVRNRCIITGRGRGVFSKFRLSRIAFKKYSLLGFLHGLRKH